MSLHDEARLRRGRETLTGKQIPEMTDEELRIESRSVGQAIAGIQSTDDPGEAYHETEGALITRVRTIDAEIERRKEENKMMPPNQGHAPECTRRGPLLDSYPPYCTECKRQIVEPDRLFKTYDSHCTACVNGRHAECGLGRCSCPCLTPAHG